ncbi:threonine--tRNA ligase [Candidatus Nomurabacteria bacterium RIFCSPLOWO2_01_FULL_41_21]|uniref:Threonine--tRNA ligase n=2 Tax=Candidatus Nomuraibacteriota TaxID=1752729 RepID=A0A1F6V1V6_9BACT|nr:MAG: threonine--tRNA ligase [Candidatus Nomurabacteria bacterium RIFCSPHIGHO2_01_FULL_40_20]OGI87978.1 MAG: threonine--tRNA ligase [Candidatus Nomurabacteria bacterium RIFCSPLOWO2_01_FULL_41_21]
MDKREKKSEKLQNQRHTLAHLLASAVLELYPDTKTTIGPSIDDGFYYDFDFSSPIGDNDLRKIEKKMRENLKSWTEFTHEEKTAEEAKEYFKDNLYKLELIDEVEQRRSADDKALADKEKITFYTCGNFTDLCRGGHVENPKKEIAPDSFQLDRLAGAYWRGDEKNKMLTRIYGLAFDTKEELSAYTIQREEAIKRDHKKLGRELDIFLFSDLVGSGLPLWTPKGTLMRNILDDFVWSLRAKYGYEKVEIPHITKKDLYITSGHWDKYADDLFRITTREGHEFAMKPMNCPHHTQIYNRKQWSYKELPQRYASTTMCYRDEQSGELSGLSRARAFTQDDAHVFCRITDAKEEIQKIWNIVHSFYDAFGLELKLRLSLRDPAIPEKYLGNKNHWDKAEAVLREIAKENKIEYFEAIGEAAFYAPKLDFMAKDSIGREWQVATIQLDVNMPERFDLYCINERGEQERIVMIHAAIMGSIERFLSIIIEHYAGAFPTWLAPVQVSIVPVRENHIEEAQKVYNTLKENDIRVELEDGDESLGKRINHAKAQKIPYVVVLGDKEVSSGTLTIEGRESKTEMSAEDFLAKLKEEIKEKK